MTFLIDEAGSAILSVTSIRQRASGDATSFTPNLTDSLVNKARSGKLFWKVILMDATRACCRKICYQGAQRSCRPTTGSTVDDDNVTLPAACLGLSIRHVSRLDRRLGLRSPAPLPARPRGCEEKVMMRIDCCSSGIHAVTPHLDDGDLAGTTCGDQLAPACR